MTRKLAIAAGLLAALALGAPTSANAQAWPSRTVTIVVPFPPGGGVDVLARIVAERLSASMKATVIVENRAGGGGTVGTRAVAKATPDGYTLMMAHTGTISINPSLYANAGYDPRKDFTAIGMIASMPVALIAHPSFPAKTVADVIAFAKKDPGKLNFGTSAIGTGGYLTAEYFKSAANVQMQIVPYRGTAPLMNDLIGGHVPVSFGVLPPAMGMLAAGKLRAIAVTGPRRFSLLPDVPTASESGLPGFELGAALWPDRTARNPARDRRPAEQGIDRHGRDRPAQAARTGRGRRRRDVEPRGIRPKHRQGRGEVVGADPQAQSAGGLGCQMLDRHARA